MEIKSGEGLECVFIRFNSGGGICYQGVRIAYIVRMTYTI